MAFGTRTNRAAAWNTANQSTYSVTNVAFTAGRLYVMWVHFHRTGAAPALSSISDIVITGDTGGWTYAGRTDTFNGGLRRAACVWKIATTTETVTVTVDPDGSGCSNGGIIIDEVESGFDSPNAVIEFAQAVVVGGVSVSAVLSGITAGNMSLGCGMCDTNGGISPSSQYTELAEVTGGSGSDQGSMDSVHDTDGDGSIAYTPSFSTADGAAMIVELAAEVAGAAFPFPRKDRLVVPAI